MASFFTFTDVAARAAADARGAPWPHLALKVRRHHVRGFSLHGERACEIGEHHAFARDAVRAARAFCRRHRYTAHIRVYDVHGDLFREIELLRPSGWAGCA